ncbi:MAG: zinc-dependent alcohol dehydrogenase family protein [Chlorobiaceae bacterium]|nr:zinc-dependent alcohol dehydrogenase family protein [Chlorobiaceae bacterium]NTV17250.1 zinc-dependent alcohol dehydrogenase family protein [Chlorobiaceae bacterium]
MKAMILDRVVSIDVNPEPLRLTELPVPKPGKGDLLIRVHTCGVCHTELDEIEGRTPPSFLPMILGHQVVGEVVECGTGVTGISLGSRRGVAWIYSACGSCYLCQTGHENLCRQFRATGRDAYGGYAEYMVAPAAFTYDIPDVFSDAEAAPLLCAGAIGYRSLKLANLKNGSVLGLTGFGASAHLVLRLVRALYPDSPVFVFARSTAEQDFARMLGADWAGDTGALSPELCDAIIDTTPAWLPVLSALERLQPGGRLVINAIRKEAGDRTVMAGIDFERHLWMEKEIKSVANITRTDVREFLDIAAAVSLKPEVEFYSLEQANLALNNIRQQRIKGAKVLRIA